MPTTPILALPYPAATDPADVPTDMGELANRVEAVRGAVNGLASLGADGRVPSAQLPTAVSTVVPLVTSLPGSPTDGQEVILVDSTTNPSYQWRLRYNAGSSSAHKWEFVGGNEIINGPVGAALAVSSTTPTVFTGGPGVTLAHAGDYLFNWGLFLQSTAAGTFDIRAKTDTIAGGVGGPEAAYISTAQFAGANVALADKRIGVIASTTIVLWVWVTAGTAQVKEGWMRVQPIRIS